jgi:CRISPR-associated endoribonuclease Cas6
MRIKISIAPLTSEAHILPVNYQYPVSAWIYRVISQGNHAFATFLHEKGYGAGNKSFKFFTFSMLDFSSGRYRVVGDRIEFAGEEIALVISFLIPQALEHFITGLFLKQEFSIGDRSSEVSFRVKSVEALPEPQITERMCFRTLSPILVSKKEEGRKAARYCHPEEELFGSLLFNNLIHKYTAAVELGLATLRLDDDTNVKIDSGCFNLLCQPRKKGITIKANTPQQTQIIGYLFDFEVMLPPELIRIGYYTGFGEKNSLGMGCCEVINQKQSRSA